MTKCILESAPLSSHSSHPKRCDYFQDLESGLWNEVGGKAARDKVGQALRDAMKALKRRSSADQTQDDINPRSNKKIRGMAERSTVVVKPNNKDASGSSRIDCSSVQCKQPSTPIVESLVVLSVLEERIATKNRASCADGQEIKNDEEEEDGEEKDEEVPRDLLQHHLPSSSPAMCTKAQVPSSGMVTVSDSVEGKNSKIGPCFFHIEAAAFNTSTSVWSKNLAEITMQTSSSANHHHQEKSCQNNARIEREEAVFLDPFEEDLEPVPLGLSGVVLGSSALLVGPPGPRYPSIYEKLVLDCRFQPIMSRDAASILSCGDDRTTSPLGPFLAKRNAILNDNLRPLDSFSALVG